VSAGAGRCITKRGCDEQEGAELVVSDRAFLLSLNWASKLSDFDLRLAGVQPKGMPKGRRFLNSHEYLLITQDDEESD
jgi:hypothetical protein